MAGTPGTLNGEPYVQFGANTIMQTINNVNAALTGNPSATVFIVLDPQANPNTWNGVFGWGDATNGVGAIGAFIGLRGTNGLSMEYAGGQPAIFGAGTTTPNAFQVIELQKSPGPINTTSSAYVNGGSELTPLAPGSSASTPNILTADPHTFALGAFTAEDPGDYLHGGVAEVIVYSTKLSSTDSANITQYLDDKYFVTPTPEPGSLSLMALGIVALGALARKSRRKACECA